ncbi:hypothetical protein NMC96_22695 (plasmid) [Citrobacter portucalensis]|uniref:hypothetical protein n=1 Tax=Citrobacter portucalensis TaxID=1639133 RepID=UPI00351D5281
MKIQYPKVALGLVLMLSGFVLMAHASTLDELKALEAGKSELQPRAELRSVPETTPQGGHTVFRMVVR